MLFRYRSPRDTEASAAPPVDPSATFPDAPPGDPNIYERAADPLLFRAPPPPEAPAVPEPTALSEEPLFRQMARIDAIGVREEDDPKPKLAVTTLGLTSGLLFLSAATRGDPRGLKTLGGVATGLGALGVKMLTPKRKKAKVLAYSAVVVRASGIDGARASPAFCAAAEVSSAFRGTFARSADPPQTSAPEVQSFEFLPDAFVLELQSARRAEEVRLRAARVGQALGVGVYEGTRLKGSQSLPIFVFTSSPVGSIFSARFGGLRRVS